MSGQVTILDVTVRAAKVAGGDVRDGREVVLLPCASQAVGSGDRAVGEVRVEPLVDVLRQSCRKAVALGLDGLEQTKKWALHIGKMSLLEIGQPEPIVA